MKLLKRPIPSLLALLLIGIAGCREDGQPRLAVESQIVQFGVVPKGGKDLEIPLKNDGTAPLEIYEVATSCACTVVKAPKVIQPGEQVSLVIRSPSHSPGPMASRLWVKSNDPASPHDFFLNWFGESPPKLAPPRLVGQNLQPGALFEQTITISYTSGVARYALGVKKTEVSNDSFELTFLKDNPSAVQAAQIYGNEAALVGEVSYLFRCRLPKQPGVVEGQCTFTVTQADETYALTLPVQLEVVGPITYAPQTVFFSAGKPADLVHKKSRVVLRIASAGEPIVTHSPDLLRCTLTPRSPGEQKAQVYLLELEVIKPPPHAEFKSTVVVQLSGERAESVVIPVQIVALP